MARRSDHSREEIKKMILDQSWKIVGRGGFEALTARRIAEDIGYAPGTIYNIFESMDDLCLQVNARTLEALSAALEGPACNDPRKSPAQNMKAMALTYMKFAEEYKPYWLMLFSHSMPQDRKANDWYQEKIDRLFAPLENLLRPLYSDKQHVKRKMAARTLWSSVHGICFLQKTGKIPLVGGQEAPAVDMASYLIDNFIAGVKQA